MGKKKQEHRKRVQKRNQLIQSQRKKLGQALQAMTQASQAPAFARATSPAPVYASTGDFIAKNYEAILNQPDKKTALEFLENEGPRFS